MDFGGREPVSAVYQDESQFLKDFEILVDRAINALKEYRSRFTTLRDAYEAVSKHREEALEHFLDFGRAPKVACWPELYLGILAGLSGETQRARELLGAVAAEECQYEWEAARRAYCEKAIDRLNDLGALREWVEENIAAYRRLRKLRPLEGPALPVR